MDPDSEEFLEAVVRELRTRGVRAVAEFNHTIDVWCWAGELDGPGAVLHDGDRSLMFGTANDVWSADVNVLDPEDETWCPAGEMLMTSVPSDCDDPAKVARGILVALAEWF